MGGIAVPQDRTLKQPVKGFCRNPRCQEKSNQEFQFKVENDLFACPKCGADRPPTVGVLVLTHLIIPQKNGPIIGKGGTQHRLACDDTRAYLATATNLEAASDNPNVANCPDCIKEADRLNLRSATGRRLLYPQSPPESKPVAKK